MGSGTLIKAFKKIAQQQPELQAIVNAIAEFVRPLEQNPLLSGRVLEAVTVGTADTNIPHKLGRKWVGWIIIGRTSSVVPYEGTQDDTGLFLTLVAASETIVDIYVF